jgi:Ca2+-binding RTX toxin-like protein
MRRLLGLSIAAVVLAAASSAGAATISRAPDGALVVTAAPGEQNRVVLGGPMDGNAGEIMVGDRIALAIATSGCSASDYVVDCQVGAAGVRVDLGDAADTFSVNFDMPTGTPVEVHGGAGDDSLTGGDGHEVLDGGDGNDSVDGRGGSDVVLGGAGDDTVMGDHFEDPAPDVIDGGPGTDTLQDDWTSRFTDLHPDVNVTLGGAADDGRPGEGDDVRGVERVIIDEGGALTGTDAPEHLEAGQTVRAVRMAGGGGNDELVAGGGADTVDGGSGDDFIDAGFGNDTITPGPGRDTVYADRQGGDCGPVWCTLPYGNDTVDLRDGEADSVDCGWGQDTVYADAIDTVAPNCETVIRSGSGSGAGGTTTPAGNTGKSTPGAHPPTRRCVVPRVTGLRVSVARRRVAAAGCRSKTVGHGKTVRRQSIKHGKSVARGTRVTLRT